MFDCLRILGTGGSLQDMDEQGNMGKETTHAYLGHFMRDMRELYRISYLNNRPKTDELGKISDLHAEVGFRGYVGCIDCM